LWSIAKTRLLRKDWTTLTKLIEAIIGIWFRNEEIAQDCRKLMESMLKRVKQLIKNKGGDMTY